MIMITNEQKEIIKNAKRQIDVLKLVKDYIYKLYNLEMPTSLIKRILEQELQIEINYSTLHYFIKTRIKTEQKTEQKKEKELEQEKKQQKTDLLEKLNLQIKNFD